MTTTVLAGTTQLRAPRAEVGRLATRTFVLTADTSELIVSGTSVVPVNLAVLAALVTVLHRRGTQETVRVDRVNHAGLSVGTVTVDVVEETTFADILAQVAAQPTGRFDALDTGVAGVDAVFGVGGEPLRDVVGQAVPRLTVRHDGGMLVGVFSYDTGRFTEVDIVALADQVQTALREGTAAPDRPVAVLNVASRDEMAIIDAWAGTGRAPVAAVCIHEAVAAQARRTPQRVAVSCGETTLTYAELDARADRLASRLVAAGAVTDEVVGVLAYRSVELVVALLAVVKAGAAYSAFDPDLPPARLHHLVADTRARVVVSAADLTDRLPTGTVVVPLTDEPATAGGTLPTVVPGNLAYVSYTSGSTGEPKGACIPHAAVARLVRPGDTSRAGDWTDFRADDVFLMLAPVAFDASTLEVWAPLVTGARLAVFPAGPVDVEALAATLVRERVTVLWLTAGLFHQMVAAHLPAFAGVRHVLAGGDVVSQTQVARLLTGYPGLTFTNGYGPTENTTFTTCWSSMVPPADRSVPIGRPISGTRVYVLDADQQPVPVGVPGELYAAGDGLARGYLNCPGATADRFRPDPSSRTGGRMYRTGDLVRWLADGTLEFLGRADRQIKVQGYRVEPGEVEAAIARRGDVRESVVVAQADGANGKRLVAYVVAEDPEDLHPRELARQVRDGLRDELPSYLVPWAVVPLDTMPLNRNGKVDRAALPPASRVARALPEPYQEPRSRVEDHVAALWSDVLGVEPVGVDDDFFELGGHSLIATEILAGLQRTLGVEITARTLYLRPTVAELAETVATLLPATSPFATAPTTTPKGGTS